MFGQIGQGGLRFQLLGFPVRIDPSFWILGILTGLGAGNGVLVALWVAVLFVSILAHEMGHAMMGRAFGLHSNIALYSMGGLTLGLDMGRLRHWQNIAISLAGPATGLLIGGLVFTLVLLHGYPTEDQVYLEFLVRQLLWVNIVWALANLLPIVPLDGGHIMASTIHWFRRYEDPALPHMISIIFGAAVALLAWKLDYTFGAILAAYFAAQNIMQLRRYGTVHPKDVQAALGVLLFVAAGTFVLLRHLGLLEGGLFG